MDDWQLIAILAIVTLAFTLLAAGHLLITIRSWLIAPNVLHRVPHYIAVPKN